MPSNIQNFISLLSFKGISKQNRFDVIVTPPTLLGPVNPQLTYRAESASFPGRSINTIDDQRDTVGPMRKIGYFSMYEAFSITFVCNKDLEEKETLEKWMDLIVGTYRTSRSGLASGNFKAGYYNNYIGTIEVFQYDEQNNLTYKIKLLEAYPTSINTLETNWNSSDVHKIVGTFSYRYYQYDDFRNPKPPRERPPSLSLIT
jgi:hypothetical protein